MMQNGDLATIDDKEYKAISVGYRDRLFLVFFRIQDLNTNRKQFFLLSSHMHHRVVDMSLTEFIVKYLKDGKKLRDYKFTLFAGMMDHVSEYTTVEVESFKEKTFPFNCFVRRIRRR